MHVLDTSPDRKNAPLIGGESSHVTVNAAFDQVCHDQRAILLAKATVSGIFGLDCHSTSQRCKRVTTMYVST
jgi:hypothetical protein